MLNYTHILVNNPLEQFEINDFVFLLAPIFGFTKLSLTNIGFYLILVFLIVLAMNLFASNHYSLIPSRWSISQESIYGSILNLVRTSIGPQHDIYVPLIYSFFTFILVGNLLGLIPYSFTVTSQLCLALSLNVTILLAVTIIGLQRHGFGFFSFFIPQGTPLGLVPMLLCIETAAYFTRGISLGVRLVGNMLSGHLLLKLFSIFLLFCFTSGSLLLPLISPLPFLLFIVLYGLELGACFIQAYIFTVLLCMYLRDAIELHTESSPTR